ncbi:DUF58 domain-containing protein [Gorillibacterium sp. sgz5001074]|uniref:DUF58 domain-containing protein n=1 Tax=Gorillibacterium sp. sgz5001074 TaxID=3446695 RepID=UPI003F666CD9
MISHAKIGVRQPARSTARTVLVLGCLGASLFFMMFQGGKLALMVFVIVAVLNLYLFLGRYSGITRVSGQRILDSESAESAVEAGSPVRVRIKLQIPGFWPVPYVMIRDRLVRKNGGGHDFEASLIPDWSRKGELEYQTPPLMRGYYHFEGTDCSTQDIFGIFEHSGKLNLPLSFTVLPQTVPVKEWKQLHRMLKGMHHHTVTTRANRETTQINGVREYSYGDRLSRIHWNATAKTGTLKSKEFERESLPKTVVLLDRQQRSYKNPEQFELAVSVAASLLQYGKNRELSLGLLSVGSDSVYFEPKGNQHGIRSMLYHLIEVAHDGFHPLQRVLEDRVRLFDPGSCMILVTPQKGEAVLKALAWLNQRQMVPCHIWLNGSAEEGKAWCKQLQSMGYMGYAVRSLDELPAALGGAAVG